MRLRRAGPGRSSWMCLDNHLQHLLVCEQLYNLAVRSGPACKQTWENEGLAYRDDCARRHFHRRPSIGILASVSERRDRGAGSFRDDIFHAYWVPRIARQLRFACLAGRARCSSCQQSQTRSFPRAWRSRLLLALRRCRVGVRVFDRLPLAFNPMTTQQFLNSAWTWNTTALVLSGVALIAYAWAFGLNRRIPYLLAALGVFVLTLVSPLNALAAGYLFSAHMLQHILLLLIVPALLLMSLPRSVSLGSRSWLIANPFVGWIAGVSAMWLWHARPLCNAAVSSQFVNALQISSLLLLGAIFWRQILAPRDEERLSPPGAVLYLFSACVACSILGILITFSPVSVCPIYA